MSDIISQFKALKLHGMAECYAEIQAQGQADTAEAIASATWLLSQLLVAEATDRSIRVLVDYSNAVCYTIQQFPLVNFQSVRVVNFQSAPTTALN